MKDKSVVITYAFQNFLKGSNRKPNKIWVDKGREFLNRSVKPWFEKSDIEMYSTHNDKKSIIAERFNRTLKNKIHEYMISVLKEYVYWQIRWYS